jgi:hypothetical protein
MASTTAAKKSETNEAKAGAAQGMQRAEDHPFFLGRMRDEFDRMFHRFTRNFPSLWEMGGNNWRWGVEVEEKDDALIVKAEAPGFEFSDFDIRVENRRRHGPPNPGTRHLNKPARGLAFAEAQERKAATARSRSESWTEASR